MFNKRYENFDNASILISGAASGIGRTITNEFISSGNCNLILLDLNLNGLNEVKEEAQKKSFTGSIEVFQVDISSISSVNLFFEQLKNRKIDILVNCAGVVSVGMFDSTPMQEIEKVINVNLIGSIRLTHSLLPLLLKSEKPSIININSVAGYVAAPGLSAYSASKFGLTGFSDALRKELGNKMQVCTIAPAFVKTNLALNTESNNKEKMNLFLHKMGANPKLVSKAVIFALKYNLSWKLVSVQAYVLYYLNRLFPWLGGKAVNFGFEILKKEGVIATKK